jgi:hypothetical protein
MGAIAVVVVITLKIAARSNAIKKNMLFAIRIIGWMPK